MKIYTLQEFNLIWDNYRKQTMGKAYYKKDWKLTKRKTVVDTKREAYLTDNGIPQMKLTPKKTVEAIDTNKITEMYIKFAKIMYNFDLKRFSSEGRYRQTSNGKGIWLKGLNSGHADIEGLVNGVMVCIEVKRPNEKLLDSQIEYKNYIDRNNGFYRVARSFEEYQEILIELEKIIKAKQGWITVNNSVNNFTDLA